MSASYVSSVGVRRASGFRTASPRDRPVEIEVDYPATITSAGVLVPYGESWLGGGAPGRFITFPTTGTGQPSGWTRNDLASSGSFNLNSVDFGGESSGPRDIQGYQNAGTTSFVYDEFTFADGRVSCWIRPNGSAGTNTQPGLVARYQDSSNMILTRISNFDDKLYITERISGTDNHYTSTAGTVTPGTIYWVEFIIEGSSATLRQYNQDRTSLVKEFTHTLTATPAAWSGKWGLQQTASFASAEFDDVWIDPHFRA